MRNELEHELTELVDKAEALSPGVADLERFYASLQETTCRVKASLLSTRPRNQVVITTTTG